VTGVGSRETMVKFIGNICKPCYLPVKNGEMMILHQKPFI
jgi:hypothetical protein